MSRPAKVATTTIIELAVTGIAWKAIGKQLGMNPLTAADRFIRSASEAAKQQRHRAWKVRAAAARAARRQSAEARPAEPQHALFADDPRARADIGSGRCVRPPTFCPSASPLE